MFNHIVLTNSLFLIKRYFTMTKMYLFRSKLKLFIREVKKMWEFYLYYFTIY